MKVRFLRIDSRLIHGQITTGWIRALKVKRILVVSDRAANDDLMTALMLQSVPENIKVNIVTVSKMIRLLNDERFDHLEPLVLVENIQDARKLIEAGLIIESLNFGSIRYTADKQMVTDAIAIGADDVDDLIWLHQHNIMLNVQKVATDSSKNLWKILIDKGLVTEDV